MTSEVDVDLGALGDAARAFEAEAERLAGAVEVLSGLGVHSGAEGLAAGTHDLDAAIGARLDEIIQALAGAGERLQQTASNLDETARSYQEADARASCGMNAIQP